jgi:hypothetical protein
MRSRKRLRRGKILFMVALLMPLLLGMAAFAVDLGWIKTTKAHLQSAADAGSLAAGIELLSGLGQDPYQSPAEVAEAAKLSAAEYVAKHIAGDVESAYIDPDRDVQLGRATLDEESGVWSFEWGVAPYNAVEVTTRRSDVGQTERDGPLPLIFARSFGTDSGNVTARSVAVLLPAAGIRITPGSNVRSDLSPFAHDEYYWNKYQRAQEYFLENGMIADDLSIANGGDLIMDPIGDGSRLFYAESSQGNGNGNGNGNNLTLLFDDQTGVLDPAEEDFGNISNSADGILEMNIYPASTTSGNFGTVDVGSSGNSTSDLKRQIVEGPSEDDLSYFPDNEINLTGGSIELEGDTGISAGMESSLEEILGQKRLIFLYSSVGGSGNNASYTIEQIVGVRFLSVNLHGSNKVLVVQPATISGPAGIPDFGEDQLESHSFYTRLILAQ